MTKRILFLCTGNYYRSRFAEIFFNQQAEQRGLNWRADSCGLALDDRNPGPISAHTLAALNELNIPINGSLRSPRSVTAEDFETADYVVAVKEEEHRPVITSQFSKFLRNVEFWQVHDLDCAGPEEAIPCLKQHVLDLLDRLAAE